MISWCVIATFANNLGEIRSSMRLKVEDPIYPIPTSLELAQGGPFPSRVSLDLVSKSLTFRTTELILAIIDNRITIYTKGKRRRKGRR
jgi:hypothetical protein